jgi:hypothetical protein
MVLIYFMKPDYTSVRPDENTEDGSSQLLVMQGQLSQMP